MKKETIISILVFLAIWTILAFRIDNDIFLPTIPQVLSDLISKLTSLKFYQVIFTTLGRALLAIIVSLIIGGILGLLAGRKKKVYDYLNPLVVILKTIPNISYMFLLLLWVNKSSHACYYIVFFIVFPLYYDAAYHSVVDMNQDLINVLRLYPENNFVIFKNVLLPNALRKMKGTLKSSISLGIKVCIMSEVLGFVRVGIGREMYFAKANLDMVSVFSWTIIVIVIVYLFEVLLKYIDKKFLSDI